MGASHSSPPPPPPTPSGPDPRLIDAQTRAIDSFFASVEDVVRKQPDTINNLVDELRVVSENDYLHYSSDSSQQHFDSMPTRVGGPAVNFITLFRDSASFYKPDLFLFLSRTSAALTQLKTAAVGASEFGITVPRLVDAIQVSLPMMIQSTRVAPSNIAGQGVYKYIQYLPMGMIAGLYYSLRDGYTSGAACIITSKELLMAATKGEMQITMIQDFERMIKTTKDTLDNWQAVEKDRDKMQPVQEFTMAVYTAMRASLATSLMQSVVDNFWHAEEFATTAEATKKWNEYVVGPDLNNRVQRMKEAYAAQLDSLNQYHDNFVKK